MASHNDDDRRRPPEEFQKLAKMTEKKWNVYRRPITLVLNVGLFVSTFSSDFTGKKCPEHFSPRKINSFNYFGINDMVTSEFFFRNRLFLVQEPFFIFLPWFESFFKRYVSVICHSLFFQGSLINYIVEKS